MSQKRFAAAAVLLASLSAYGAPQLDAVESCYAKAKIQRPPQDLSRHLFVFIDQTTVLDEGLKRSVRENVRHNLKPDTAFTIATFSAYLGDRYADVVVAGHLDAPLTPAEKHVTDQDKLQRLERCLGAQVGAAGDAGYAGRLIESSLNKSFASASKDISKSDVLASLKDFADHIVAVSPAKQKIILLVSDMLENSSISSFYSKKAVRKIDPESELQKVRERQLIGNFDGASVYVIGGGLLQTAGGYRDPDTMRRLETFWTQYFKTSKANLTEFGKPALLRPVE